MSGKETYPAPEYGWCCFHCGETFVVPALARDHFGWEPGAAPACRVSPGHVRKELRRYRSVESVLHQVQEELITVLSLGDGAPFLPADSDRVYDLLTKAIEAIGSRYEQEEEG